MNCPKCTQDIDPGAAFCGNCGQSLAILDNPQSAPTQPNTSQQAETQQNTPQNILSPQPQSALPPHENSVPSYAVPNSNNKGSAKPIIGLVLAIIGLPASIIPILGLALGISGIILGSMSMKFKKVVAILAIVFGSLAVVASLAMWVYFFNTINEKLANPVAFSTPCYQLEIPGNLYKFDQQSTCDTNLADSQNWDNSEEFYQIIGRTVTEVNSSNFQASIAAAANELVDSVKFADDKFTIKQKEQTVFKGESAYRIYANSNSGMDLEIIFVYKEVGGYNFFTFASASSKGDADIHEFAKSFSWK